MHRDSRYFADPLSFRPERWTPDFERKLPLCAYLPFGRGARSCVAGALSTLILQCMLASIIQRFRPEPSIPLASTDCKPFDRGDVPLTLHARR
jgi:cytochrome P450